MKITQPRTDFQSPSGPAGGDLSGAFPGPTVTGLRGIPICVTAPNTGDVLTFDGSDWCPSPPLVRDVFTIAAVFDAGLSAITGNPEVDVLIPAAGTITSWTLLADAAGNAVIDIWKDVYANYPPTVADSIVHVGSGGVEPTLSGVTKNQTSTLTHWTTSLTAGDVIRFHLDSSSTVKRLELTLLYTRT